MNIPGRNSAPSRDGFFAGPVGVPLAVEEVVDDPGVGSRVLEVG